MAQATRIKRNNRRQEILERDRHTCQCCCLFDRLGSDLEIHHIEAVSAGGSSDESNLITLCGTCHIVAPKKADAFLGYQRVGGLRTMRRDTYSVRHLAERFPDITLKEYVKMLDKERSDAISWIEAGANDPGFDTLDNSG